jgi:uncharacterized protein YndB with AHSA1/START domain
MDILVERTIHAAPEEVARIMFDPDNDPQWISGARSVERLTPGPMGVGTRVRHEGGFLGRKFSWVTEITALEPETRLEMNIVDGPIHGEVSYEVRPTAGGAIAAVHNRGGSNLPLPGMAWMVKRAVNEDLRRLAKLVAHQHG